MLHLLLAAGESAEPMTVNILPFLTGLAVFIIAFAVLYLKAWPMITKGLDEREKKIRDAISEADEAREKARDAQAEYESSLADARQQANQMIAEAKANAKTLADQLRTQSEAELAEMKQRANREIDAARQAAVASLHEESAALATAIATRILQREINAGDQQRLIDESLAELGKVSN